MKHLEINWEISWSLGKRSITRKIWKQCLKIEVVSFERKITKNKREENKCECKTFR